MTKIRGFALLLLVIAGVRCSPAIDTASSSGFLRVVNVNPLVAFAGIRPCADGNYLVLSTVAVPSDSIPLTAIEISKCDAHGNILWTTLLGGPSSHSAGDCVELANGTIAVAGTDTLNAQRNNLVFYLLDANGNQLRHDERFYAAQVGATFIRHDDNTGFLVVGHIRDSKNSVDNALLFFSVAENGDSLGYTMSSPGSNGDYYSISDISSIQNGNALTVGEYHWARSLYARQWFTWNGPNMPVPDVSSTSYFAHLLTIARTSVHEFLMAGDTGDFNSPIVQPWIAKIRQVTTTDPPSILWSHQYVDGVRGHVLSITNTEDGGSAATGIMISKTGDTSALLIRLDSSGREIWPHKVFTLTHSERPQTILETADGGFLIAGVSAGFGGGRVQSVFLLKTDAKGTIFM